MELKQDKEFKFEFTTDEINTIGAFLIKEPFEVVGKLINGKLVHLVPEEGKKLEVVLNAQEINVIGLTLIKQPYQMVNEIINNMNAQLYAQSEAKQE